ncbi:MAG: 2-dehydropantoate 2-reductase [Candidatus Thermoplasmatota archaeon]
MNITIFGAGAIGSLFGAKLSYNNKVKLIARKPHVEQIKKKGLTIEGKTKFKKKICAEDKIQKLSDKKTDLLILSVKSYDTEEAIKEAKKIIKPNTLVLSLQNGLNNLEKISKHIKSEKIILGITTEAAIFSKPGYIIHTAEGITKIGAVNCKRNDLKKIKKTLMVSGFKTKIRKQIKKEIWKKAIINSSINPITAFLQCKNGYLLENPILERCIEKICEESINAAEENDIKINEEKMIKKTKAVIKKTGENYSSMAQSIANNKKTEIDSINGKIAELSKDIKIDCFMNEILLYLIKSKSKYF